jgi:hypothetical protein
MRPLDARQTTQKHRQQTRRTPGRARSQARARAMAITRSPKPDSFSASEVDEPKSGSWVIAGRRKSAEPAEMQTQGQSIIAHPMGEQPMVEAHSAIADTFAGRIHVEWDATAPVTPFGQLPFFIDYLKQAGLFDAWVADCPLSLTSPNAPRKRDLLGTVLLSVLAGHRRYAHITSCAVTR